MASPTIKKKKLAPVLLFCLILAASVLLMTVAGCRWSGQASTKGLSDLLGPGTAIVGPNDSGKSVARDLEWVYQGRKFAWQVETPQQLLDWDRNVNRLTAGFYSGKYSQAAIETMPVEFRQLVLADSVEEGGDLAPWANDTHNSQWTGDLANQLQAYAERNGFDYFHTAEFIQSFVCGAISYQNTYAPELSAQTLVDNGDCKDKSILLAALLESLSYKVTLLEFSSQNGEPGHMAVGVAFTNSQLPQGRELSYYRYKGCKYYFAETTAPDWPLGTASLKEPAHIYDVN